MQETLFHHLTPAVGVPGGLTVRRDLMQETLFHHLAPVVGVPDGLTLRRDLMHNF